jgi:hypothetical protein
VLCDAGEVVNSDVARYTDKREALAKLVGPAGEVSCGCGAPALAAAI